MRIKRYDGVTQIQFFRQILILKYDKVAKYERFVLQLSLYIYCEAFSKKYFRVAKYVSVVDSVLIGITVCAEATGAVLLATGVAAPIALGLGISGVATGAISLFGNIAVRKTTIRAEKHLKIKMLTSAKLVTIASHISKALMDDHINDDEFKLIMEELNKYKAMKEEIRNNTKKKLKEEEEASLIERGRQEARESFWRLVEKSNTETYKTTSF